MALQSTPVIIDLEDRLECYGCFNSEDYVCRSYCALSLTCAVANKSLLDGQLNEAPFLSLT
ncbi:MAG: hypothetical protein LBF38_10635 [Deltaproteobacteria bacterium]|jgi:hypothetical protein|nr:hypothetical protein [Deltaproteobacteria bacterium]